jgi:hypothetical protein
VLLKNCPATTELTLDGNLLSGTLPPSLGVRKLDYMSMRGNNISGTLPTGLFATANLSYLILNGNLLSGSLPTQCGDMSGETLVLADNRLSGSIPSELGLASLGFGFNLHLNSISGTVGGRNRTFVSPCASPASASPSAGGFESLSAAASATGQPPRDELRAGHLGQPHLGVGAAINREPDPGKLLRPHVCAVPCRRLRGEYY